MSVYQLEPIGWVTNSRTAVEDDEWDRVPSVIELAEGVLEPDATLGLDAFSHIVVLYVFDRVDATTVCRGARHPRGREDWPRVGILAQRAKDRPNRLGLTTCRLLSVSARRIEVAGLDAVTGTPVVDIKPHMAEFGPRGAVFQPSWATALMAGYW